MKRLLPVFISICMLFAVIFLSDKGENNEFSVDSSPDSVSALKVQPTSEKTEEMRGVWVSYLSLNISSKEDYKERFKEKFDKIAEKSKNSGFNTLIVQVRPFSDSLYKSKIFPTSHLLTGVQGEKTDFDPLQYMCKKCHESGLKIHAWVNPYRVKLKESEFELSADNPAVVDKGLTVNYDGGIYYNPALESVRNLITNGVKEIAENYDVDGIQFDDYFYPTVDESFDKTQYNEYKSNNKNALSLSDWRKNNVNMLIADVYLAIKSINKNIEFGISPQGNIKNNDKLFADVYSWCGVKGYIDYICPQLYYSLDNPAKPFEKALEEWLDVKKHNDLKLYIGLAGYKGGSDSDGGTWLDNDDILAQEIEILREKKADGFMLYSYEALENGENKKEVANVISLLT